MIIKRMMKIETPNLKRCKMDGSKNAIQKKHRVNGFYSLGMPGDAEYFSSGSVHGVVKGRIGVVVRFSPIRILCHLIAKRCHVDRRCCGRRVASSRSFRRGSVTRLSTRGRRRGRWRRRTEI